MTNYLVLKFENAGLICGKSKHFVRSSHGNRGKIEASEGHDKVTPIPYTLLSNVLHKLCGEIPVPSKRPTIFKRLEVFDDIAKNSYIKYGIKPIQKKSGYGYDNSEVFVTSKYAFNAHQKVNATFKLHDGSVLKRPGRYTWSYLEKACENKANFDLFCDFLTGIIGEDCRKYTMEQFITKLSAYWGNEEFNAKAERFMAENKFLPQPWANLLFNKPASTSNTNFTSKTPLLVTSGVSEIIYLNGKIVCPIDNEEIIQALRENSGTATILEHGLVYIDSLTNIFDDDGYERIFDENQTQAIDN